MSASEPTPSSGPSVAVTMTDPSARRRARGDRRLAAGDSIGRYVVLEPLGAGGMGVVYAAWDSQLDRKVAIKLLHADHDDRRSTEGRARLVREAKALAQLSHPNVVTVHEVGTEGERVYLAMEHVEGRTLGRWLEEGERTRAEILAAFLAAGEGLAAAHDKGLVHRDFKPDNVMIGASGRVRVMDFGLARGPVGEEGESLDEPELPADLRMSDELSAPLTRGSALMGTPAYMAPEQWKGGPVDARTDQYSFCVTLYEALYGQRPFSGVAPGALMVAAVRGEIEAAPAGARVPAWLRRVLVRGLARDPDERFADMRALLSALRSDPTARRRRWVVAASVLGLVGLGVGARQLVVARDQARCEALGAEIEEVWSEAEAQRIRAALAEVGEIGQVTATRMEPLVEDYVRGWSTARTAVCQAPPGGVVDGEPLAERAVACLDERRATLQGFLAAVGRPGGGGFERAVRVAAALPPVSSCIDPDDLRRRPTRPDDPATRERIDELRAELARTSMVARIDPGEAVIDRARQLLAEADELGWEPLRAEAGVELGYALQLDGRLAEAEPVYANAYFHAAAVEDLELAMVAADRLTFVVGTGLHRPDDGVVWSRLADVAARRIGFPEEDLRHANRLGAQAGLAFTRGDYEAAAGLHERELEIREALLGPEHPSLVSTLEAIANCYSGLDDGQRAMEVLQRALVIVEQALGPDHPDVAWMLMNLSLAHGVEQRYDESHELSARALAIRERVYGPDHRFVGHSLDFMCAADADRGRLDRADEECARALAIHERELGLDHPDTAWSHYNIGLIARMRGQTEEARRHWEMALAVLASALGDEHPRTMITRRSLAELDSPGHEGAPEHHGAPGHEAPPGH